MSKPMRHVVTYEGYPEGYGRMPGSLAKKIYPDLGFFDSLVAEYGLRIVEETWVPDGSTIVVGGIDFGPTKIRTGTMTLVVEEG